MTKRFCPFCGQQIKKLIYRTEGLADYIISYDPAEVIPFDMTKVRTDGSLAEYLCANCKTNLFLSGVDAAMFLRQSENEFFIQPRDSKLTFNLYASEKCQINKEVRI